MLLACSENRNLSVRGIKPSRGAFMNADSVIIEGTGFSPTQGVKVYFGERPARNPVIDSESTIRVDPPAGEPGQVVDVRLVFDDARSIVVRQGFSYYDPLAGVTGASAPAKP